MYGHGKGYGKWGTWGKGQQNQWHGGWWNKRWDTQPGNKSWRGQKQSSHKQHTWVCSQANCAYEWNKTGDKLCAKCGKDSGWKYSQGAGKGSGTNNWKAPKQASRAATMAPEPSATSTRTEYSTT
jgi:hypothetical protein